MGIKDLWSIITPYSEKKPLHILENQTVAIDLSCWICEAQNVVDYSVYARMHLRNLYFRTNYLLLNGIRPIFVLEGEVPELKEKVLKSRGQIQFRGAPTRSNHVSKSSSNRNRSRFQKVLKQCKKMLNLMGIECLQAVGEAEATCAYLNRKRIVDGCVSQDSDCFAYGADTVYRNFSLTSTGKIKSYDGSVEVYSLSRIQSYLKDFGQHKIVALGLFCGCDYDEGVPGVGKESVLKFLNQYSDVEALDKIRSWRNCEETFENLEMRLNEKLFCKSCGHQFPPGRNTHRKDGCLDCGTIKDCRQSDKYKSFVLNTKNEVQIRKKALMKNDFPNEKLISEFLDEKDTITKQIASLKFQWRCPDLAKFIEFASMYLEWEELYAFEKLFPLVTRWHLLNPKIKEYSMLVPTADIIQKKRQLKGKNYYQVLWNDPDHSFDKIIAEIKESQEEDKDNLKKKVKSGDNDIDDEDGHENENEKHVDLANIWITVEPTHLMENVYPRLVVDFLKSNEKPIRKNIKSVSNELTGAQPEIWIFLAKSKKKRKSPSACLDLSEPHLEDASVNISLEYVPAMKKLKHDSIIELDDSIVIDDVEVDVDSQRETSFFFEHNFKSNVDLFEKSCDKIIVLSSDDDDDDD